MITILHNPRCSKSRQGVQILEEAGIEFKTRLYLKDTLTLNELKDILKKLDLKPIDVIRTGEAIWKAQFKDIKMNDLEIMEAMLEHPKLIERPIVIYNNKGIIGRPPENIKSIL